MMVLVKIGFPPCARCIAAWSCIVVLLGLCGLPGCTAPPDFAQVITLDPATRDWIAREKVWGDGWQVAAGSGQYLDFGAIPDGGVLRLSFLEDAASPMPVTATVYAGESKVHTFTSLGPDTWAHYRLDLARYGGQEQSCRVLFDCEGEFALGQCELRKTTAAQPNILIFMIDTLRLDHMGCYGYERDTTPMLDAFRQEAIPFSQLMPQSSWTRPSVASLFTGVYPATHGAVDVMTPLRENLPSLARSLEQAGYETHAFVSNPNCLPDMNIGLDYNVYRDSYCDEWKEADDAKLVEDVIDVLPFVQDRPWLIYAHVMGPHAPYEPPEAYATQFTAMPPTTSLNPLQQKEIDLYDAEIAYTDQQFGKLIAALKAQGLYDNTIIMVVSDHGEEFWEHGGTDHGKTLYEEQLRVPFILKPAGHTLSGEMKTALVEMVDVPPTLLSMVGAAPDPRMQGQSLQAYIEGGEAPVRPGYASLYREEKQLQTAKNLKHKFLIDLNEQQSQWYDLEADPGEQQPLAETPENGEALVQHAAMRSTQGQSGLHIVFTKAAGETREVVVEIAGEAIGAYGLEFPHDRGTLTMDHDNTALRFDITLTDIQDDLIRELWEMHGKRDVAHAFAQFPLTATPTVSLRIDGAPADPAWVQAGTDKTALPLTGEALDLESITALTSDFEQDWDNRELGVYIWFQPAVDSLSEDSLSEERRDALEGLGYL